MTNQTEPKFKVGDEVLESENEGLVKIIGVHKREDGMFVYWCRGGKRHRQYRSYDQNILTIIPAKLKKWRVIENDLYTPHIVEAENELEALQRIGFFRRSEWGQTHSVKEIEDES